MSALRFQRDINRFIEKTYARLETLTENVHQHVGRSIRFGSSVTGAPGQPVRSGQLLASWREYRSGSSRGWRSSLRYARYIEDNLRGMTLRSKVGGFHSVKLTRAGYKSIVRHELNNLGPSGAGIVFDRKVGRYRTPTGQFTKRPR